MPATRLYIVHGSHPCAAIAKALELKGIDYKVFEFTPPSHALGMRLLFGDRTVPGIKFDDGEKVQGSTAIMEALDRRVPSPPLYPDERVREAERWGEETLQPLGRTLLWPSFARSPEAMHSFQQGSKLPALPMPAIKVMAPGIVKIERSMNSATDDVMRVDLDRLPGYLDKIDAWIDDGVLGGEQLNAADLQIGATINLLMSLDDLRPLIEPRPAGQLARRIYAPILGSVPAGTIPADWLPKVPAAA
jgi:glutathione S-transferase